VPKKPARQALTALQEAFASLVGITGLKLGDAYLEAGYAEPKTKQKLWELASVLRKTPHVSARIDDLRQAAAENTVLDRTWIIERLRANVLDAQQLDDYAASNKALELIGREVFGMFTVRKEIKHGSLNALSPDDLRTRIAQQLRDRGVGEGALAALLKPGRRGVAGTA
jgi:hypothetical protein